MALGLPTLKLYVKLQFYKMNKLDDTMIQKPLKCLVSKEKYVSKLLRSLLHHWLAYIVIHCATMYSFEKNKLSGEGLLKGRGIK